MRIIIINIVQEKAVVFRAKVNNRQSKCMRKNYVIHNDKRIMWN